MATRDITPIMQKLRNLMNRRTLKNYLRFEGKISPRNIPAPNIPHGVSGKLSDNYFYTRDGRRGVFPASEPFIYGIDATKPAGQLQSGETAPAAPAKSAVPQPGQKYAW